ncbi:MAG: type II toxin-antitoxin system HicB family antitoxin [Treponema sp.]|nr:type II toxin-antitoxin system HicB family antitoxin [Treponema sp.]
MKYVYSATFKEEDGKVYARTPDLDGCVTTGKDWADAIEQMSDAMAAWLCVAEDQGLPIPAPTPQHKIALEPGQVISIIKADTMEYRAKTDTRAVRKNVSLPAFLARLADRRRVNCSQVLQDALMAMF